MKSSDVPITVKATIAGTLGYLILPMDLVSDFIPVVGYADDTTALVTVVRKCKEYITPEIENQATAKLDELLG